MPRRRTTQRIKSRQEIALEAAKKMEITHLTASLPEHAFIGSGSFNMAFQCPNPSYVIKRPFICMGENPMEATSRILRTAKQLNPQLAKHITKTHLETDGHFYEVVQSPFIEQLATDREGAEFFLISLQKEHRFIVDIFSPGNVRKTTDSRWLNPGQRQLYVIVDTGLALDLRGTPERPQSPTSRKYWSRETWKHYTYQYWPKNARSNTRAISAKVCLVCSRILDLFGYEEGHKRIKLLNVDSALALYRFHYELTGFLDVRNPSTLDRHFNQALCLSTLPTHLHSNSAFLKAVADNWDLETFHHLLKIFRKLGTESLFEPEIDYYLILVEYPILKSVFIELQRTITPDFPDETAPERIALKTAIETIMREKTCRVGMTWVQTAKDDAPYTLEWLNTFLESPDLWKGVLVFSQLLMSQYTLLWEIYSDLTTNRELILSTESESFCKAIRHLKAIQPDSKTITIELLKYVSTSKQTQETIAICYHFRKRIQQNLVSYFLFDPTTRNIANLQRHLYLTLSISTAIKHSNKKWQKKALSTLKDKLQTPQNDEALRAICLNIDHICSWRRLNCAGTPRLLSSIRINMTPVRESYPHYPFASAIGGSKSAQSVGCRTKKMWGAWLKGKAENHAQSETSKHPRVD